MPNYGGEGSGPSDMGGGSYSSDSNSGPGSLEAAQNVPVSAAGVRVPEEGAFGSFWNGIKAFGGWINRNVIEPGKQHIPPLAQGVLNRGVNLAWSVVNEPVERVDAVLGTNYTQTIPRAIATDAWGKITDAYHALTSGSFDASLDAKSFGRESAFYGGAPTQQLDPTGPGGEQWPWQSMSSFHRSKKGNVAHRASTPSSGATRPRRSYHSARMYGRSARVTTNRQPVIYK